MNTREFVEKISGKGTIEKFTQELKNCEDIDDLVKRLDTWDRKKLRGGYFMLGILVSVISEMEEKE